MHSIRQRLLQAPDRFLLAVGDGLETVEAFDKFWATLCQDIQAEIRSNNVDDALMSTIHIISSTMQVLAEAFCRLEDTHQRITSSMVEEMDAVFSHLTLDEVTPTTPTSLDDDEQHLYSTGPEKSTERPIDVFISTDVERPSLDEQFDTPSSSFTSSRCISSEPSLTSCSSSDESEDDSPKQLTGDLKRSTHTTCADSATKDDNTCQARRLKRLRDEGKDLDLSQKLIAGQKRSIHSLCVVSATEDTGTQEIRVSKRLRLESEYHGFRVSEQVYLPSSQKCQFESASESGSSEEPDLVIPPQLTRRKRKLSDADTADIPKRPRHSARPQAVSDPFPPIAPKRKERTFSLDGWFESHFTMPQATLSTELDSSVPVDIHVFDDWVPADASSCNNPGIADSPVIITAVEKVELPADGTISEVLPGSLDVFSDVSSAGDVSDSFKITLCGSPSIPGGSNNVDHVVTPESLYPSSLSYPEQTASVSSMSCQPDNSTFTSTPAHSSLDALSDVDVLTLLSVLSDAESPPSTSRVAPLCLPDRGSPPPLYPSPPSFLDSVNLSSTASIPWDPYWNPLELLQDFDSPPPPYHRTPDLLEEIEASETKTCDISTLVLDSEFHSKGAIRAAQIYPEKRTKLVSRQAAQSSGVEVVAAVS